MITLKLRYNYVKLLAGNWSFFLYVFFSHDIYNSQASRRRRPFVIPLYYFHPPHEHLHINRAIAAESSPLLMAMAGLESGNL